MVVCVREREREREIERERERERERWRERWRERERERESASINGQGTDMSLTPEYLILTPHQCAPQTKSIHVMPPKKLLLECRNEKKGMHAFLHALSLSVVHQMEHITINNK